MPDVRPFRGLRYNPSLAGDLTSLISPPYDVISPSQQADLHRRSPYNAVRLELSESRPGDTDRDNRYTRTAAAFQGWLKQGILAREDDSAMYMVEESYSLKGAVQKRRGLMACVRLEEFGRGSIFPHEHTTEGPKKDRLELIKACNANFSPIMGLFPDADGSVQAILSRATASSPTAVTQPIEDGLAYRVWVLRDEATLSKLQDALEAKPVYIADGHHRYETALKYRDSLKERDKPASDNSAANFIMMSLIPLEDPGLLVMPYHRLLSGLSDREAKTLWSRIETMFHVEAVRLPSSSPEAVGEAVAARLAKTAKDEIAFGVFDTSRPEKAVALLLKKQYALPSSAPPLERCDSRYLSQAVLRPALSEVEGPVLGEAREKACVSFVHDGAEAVESVQKGECQMAILLKPLPMDLFQEVVSRGDRLPPKSTYFYPKLPTGLVFNHLVGEAG